MRVILHIGLHKTGTTAIQYMLNRNRALLRSKLVLYDPGEGPSHNGMLYQFRAGDPIASEHLRRMLRESPAYTVLISSEMLCELETDIDAFLRQFNHYHDIEAIAYIRRPDQMIASAHAECVRNSQQRRTAGVLDLPRPYDPTYRALLDRWMVRGDVRLKLAPYDPQQWVGGSLLTDFLAMIGVESNGLDLDVPEEGANYRLSALQTEVLRAANTVAMSPEQHEALVSAIATLPVSGFEPEIGEDALRDEIHRAANTVAMSPEQRAALVAAIAALPMTELFRKRGEELPDDAAKFLRDKIRPHLHMYRHFFRKGFDERFLVG